MANNVLNRFERADASGDNALICDGTISGSVLENLETVYLFVYMPDMSTADFVYVFPRFPGTVIGATLVSGEDVTGTAIFTLAVTTTTIAGNSLALTGNAGATDIFVATADNTFTNSEVLRVETDGGSTNVCPAYIIFELEPT